MLDFIDLEFLLQLIAFIGEEAPKQEMPALAGLIALSIMLFVIFMWIQPPPKKNPFEQKKEEEKDKSKPEVKEPVNLEQKIKESNARRFF